MTNRITAGISVIALVALIATSGLAAQQPAPAS
jgi:hypothetical protein